jgi:transglutaminase-like putative cysteine protease
MVWGLAVWSVSAWAGYTQFRKQQSLAALTPAAALLATTLAYTLSHTGALLPIVAATLLLLGLTHYLGREQQWEAARTDYALDVRLDLGLAVVAITLGLTVMAGAAPAFSIKQIARLAQEYFQAAPVVNSLGMRRLPASSPLPTEVRAPGLPRRHLLGSGPELSKQVVMVITSADASAEPPRLYWRALTYDIYTGRGWLTSDTTAHDYAAGQPVRKPTAPARRPLRQTVQFVDNPNRLLFAAGEPVAADMPFTANRRSHADWFGAIIDAEIYQVDSLVPAASAQELRAAGSAYPNWLEQRYLRLPPTVPPRVLSLALDLTATAPTPFDRALAIEAYLRRIPYTLDLPEPPRRAEDMADYFLFDLRRGYCDYYATAMVVLARAAGLPARLAVGYVSNHYEAGRSLVTAADAHSWSEIYFPEHGWINFEPTGGRAALTRAPEPIALPPSIPFTAFVPPAGVRWWPWLAAPAGLIAAGLLGGLGWLAVDDWRLRRAAPAAAIDRIYRRLYRRGLALGAAAQPGHTPFEFAAAFSRRLTALSNARPRRVNLAAAPLAVERLAALLVQSRYSPHPPTSAHQSEAIRLWRQMRLHLWWAQFFGKTS